MTFSLSTCIPDVFLSHKESSPIGLGLYLVTPLNLKYYLLKDAVSKYNCIRTSAHEFGDGSDIVQLVASTNGHFSFGEDIRQSVLFSRRMQKKPLHIADTIGQNKRFGEGEGHFCSSLYFMHFVLYISTWLQFLPCGRLTLR